MSAVTQYKIMETLAPIVHVLIIAGVIVVGIAIMAFIILYLTAGM
ncbi:MAG: hypothetical protein K0Q79_1146 [Flavipsychrobacter sp.]|jgi:multisubunit Na+/H+ antiporter MnhC subunit|nr:hypothetical protein [Flavipsychrobacter sp.]